MKNYLSEEIRTENSRISNNRISNFPFINSYSLLNISSPLGGGRILCILLTLLTLSCRKDEPPVTETPEGKNALLILNEGLFQQNNSSMTFYDFDDEETRQQFFLETNERGLGDTGNDMVEYGTKIYVVVNVSGQVEVMNKTDFKSVKQISLIDNGQSRQPRFAHGSNGKVWVTNFDGTVAVIDTASLEVEQFIDVGKNPEQIKESGGYLYVANSGGLDFPNYDSTVSIIDPNTKMVINTQTIGINPGAVAKIGNQSVLVMSRGNYDDIDPQLYKVNTTEAVPVLVNENIKGLYASGGKVIVKKSTGNGDELWEINTDDLSLEKKLPFQPENYDTFYGIEYLPTLSYYVIKDAKNYSASGKVHLFNSQGSEVVTITTGLLPVKTIYIP